MENKLNAIYKALLLFFIMVLMGIVSYMTIEGYTFLEAFFMTIITMSTVGFREVHTLSDPGMIFTVILIVSSFGVFAYLVTAFTQLLVSGEFYRFYQNYTMRKKMRKMKAHVIVCGYGRNGTQAVTDLLEHNEHVIVIERKGKHIPPEHANLKNFIWIEGDATQDETLEKAKVEKAKALITTLPDDASNLLVTLTARGLNKNLKIISRASAENADSKLRRAGADSVIMPDRVGGARMARLVAQENVIEFLDTLLLRDEENVNLEEISCDEIDACYINTTVGELNIRKISGANLIGLRTPEGKIIFNPSADTVLIPDAKLFALGKPDEIIRLKEMLTGGNWSKEEVSR